MDNNTDYYTILQLPPKSSFEQIKGQYRRLAKVFHPDRNPNDQWCEGQLKRVNEAYRYLSDPTRKAIYDESWPSANSVADASYQEKSVVSDPPASNPDEALCKKPKPKWNAQLKRTGFLLCVALMFWAVCIYHIGKPLSNGKSMLKPVAAVQSSQLPSVVRPTVSSTPYIPTAKEQNAALSHFVPHLPARTDHQFKAPPSDLTPMEELDQQNRISSARRLESLGVEVDWHSHSAMELLDMENRVSSANRLHSLGQSVNWQDSNAMDMLDQENRIATANRLQKLGYPVAWKDHTATELLDWENRISTAKRLATKGVNVDWHQHSASDLLELEMKAGSR